MTVILGGMDVARVKPPNCKGYTINKRIDWDKSFQPAVVTSLRGVLGAAQVIHIPGERRPPGPEWQGRLRMGD